MTDKVATPEGDVAEVSLDYTLTDEGEGDNINGNKELRDEAEHEDENNSKRPKVPLNPDPAERENPNDPTASIQQSEAAREQRLPPR